MPNYLINVNVTRKFETRYNTLFSCKHRISNILSLDLDIGELKYFYHLSLRKIMGDLSVFFCLWYGTSSWLFSNFTAIGIGISAFKLYALILISVNRFIWLECYLCYNSLELNQLFILNFWRFWFQSEAFIRKIWYAIFPVLDTTERYLVKLDRAQQSVRLKRTMVNWSNAMMIDREPERLTRCKAVSTANTPGIGTRGQLLTQPRLDMTSSRRVKSRRTEYQLLLTKASDETETSKLR